MEQNSYTWSARVADLSSDSSRSSMGCHAYPSSLLVYLPSRLRLQARARESKEAMLSSESAASELATQTATSEARRARTLDLAQVNHITRRQSYCIWPSLDTTHQPQVCSSCMNEQETVRSLQQQLRRKEDEILKYQQMLAEARQALRKEKASAAANSERLTERLYQQHEEGINQLQQV